MEDHQAKCLVRHAEHCDRSNNPVHNSTDVSSLISGTGAGFNFPNTEIGSSSQSGVPAGQGAYFEEGLRSFGTSNQGKCLSKSKELISHPLTWMQSMAPQTRMHLRPNLWLLGLGGDFLDERSGADSGHQVNRTPNLGERRRHSRSEVWERLRGGLDGNGHHNTTCPTGIHPRGMCSCGSFLMTEESSARASISRIVMLAEALFESTYGLSPCPSISC